MRRVRKPRHFPDTRRVDRAMGSTPLRQLVEVLHNPLPRRLPDGGRRGQAPRRTAAVHAPVRRLRRTRTRLAALPRAIRGLKFSAALPQRFAVAMVAARPADFEGARAVLGAPVRFQHST